MIEVIRLIVLSLALRVLAAAAGTAVSFALSSGDRLPFQLVALAPSVILLALAAAAPRRGWTSRRFVKGLLLAMIVSYAIEIAVSALLFRLTWAGVAPRELEMSQQALGRWRAVLQFGLSTRPAPAVPLVFILIPAILGAWIDGKRDGMRWALFTMAISSVGIILFILSAPEDLESNMWRALGIGEFLAQAVVIFVVCYFVGSLADQQRAEQAQLEAANRQLADQAHVREQLAASRERVRLARDLHDTLAHTLAGLAIQINAVGALLKGEQPEVRRELAYTRQLVEDGLVSTRQAIGDLRANGVADLGLVEALRRRVELAAQRSGIQAAFAQEGDIPELSDEVAGTLFRIAQEALINVERHAQAQHAAVTLRAAAAGDAPALTLIIQDDGVGFDPIELDDQKFGLRGMRERAELIGARLRVDSVAGEGTRVTVAL
jgi:signal transduction histidine kinase